MKINVTKPNDIKLESGDLIIEETPYLTNHFLVIKRCEVIGGRDTYQLLHLNNMRLAYEYKFEPKNLLEFLREGVTIIKSNELELKGLS